MKTRQTEHVMAIPAPAAAVYRLIEDAENWPAIFTPTVHVQRLEPTGDGAEERLRIWAFAGANTVKSWISHRTLDPATGRIAFRQTRPASPVAAMRGEWIVAPDGAGCLVIFRHWFSAEHDDEATLGRIAQVVDHNSRAELDSLRAAVDRAHLLVDWEDEVGGDASQDELYRFLAEAGSWPGRIPHVARVELTEQPGDVQVLEMDTKPSTGGATHTTVSVRVLLPPDTIVYKQTTLPEFLHAHVGSWSLREDGTAVARHTVVLKQEAITAIIGPDATVSRAAELVRESIGGNSRATLRRAHELTAARP